MSSSWRQEILYALLLVMEVCWLAPAVAIVSSLAARQPLPAWAIFALYLAAFWSGRLIHHLQLDAARSKVLAIYLCAACILVFLKLLHYGAYSWLSVDWLARLGADLASSLRHLPPAAVTVAVGLVAWWRGLGLSGRPATLGLVVARFQAGLVAFVVVLVLATQVPRVDVSLPVFGYFAGGLLAMAIARVEGIAGGRGQPADRFWLGVLALAVGLVLVLGSAIVVALVSSGSLVAGVFAVLSPILEMLGALFLLLLTPFGYLAEWLVNLLRPLTAGVRPLLPVLPTPGPELEQGQGQVVQLPMPLQGLFHAAALVAFLALAVWLISSALSRRRDYMAGDLDEIRESVGGLGSLWNDARAAAASLWARLTARARQRTILPGLSLGQEVASLSIRQIYARLLLLAARLGAPRRPEQTPYEYLGDLGRLFPTARDDLTVVTEKYVRARYSPEAPTSEDVRSVREAWNRFRKELATRH